jgi:hypothetical protein
MRLHSGVAPGEQFHAYAGSGFKDFSLVRADETRLFTCGFEERKDIRAVETSDAAKGGDRRTHLATLQAAEKSDRNAGGSCDLGERESAARAETAKTLAGVRRRLCGSGHQALALKNVDDGGGIETAGTAKKNRALEKAHVGFGIKTIAALSSLWRDEAQGFPGTEGGGRNADAAGHLADAQGAAQYALRGFSG